MFLMKPEMLLSLHWKAR